jgi:thioredoxin 1
VTIRFVEDVAEFDRSVTGPGALVLFTAPWCSPGERMAAALADPASTMPIEVLVVDADRHPTLPRRYGVAGLPSLILFRSGLVAGQRTGELSLAGIEGWVETTLEPEAGSGVVPGLKGSARGDDASDRL